MPGHFEIGDHQVGRPLPHNVEGRCAVSRSAYVVPTLLKLGLSYPTEALIVIDYENALLDQLFLLW